MSSRKPVLEPITRQLIVEGKNNGGFVTYQFVADVLKELGDDVTLGSIDVVDSFLTAERIQIVDSLPKLAHFTRDDLESILKFRREEIHIWNSRFRFYSDSTVTLEYPYVLCPEMTLDVLLVKAEDEELSDKDIEDAIDACSLTPGEATELIEYLWLKGINVPDITVYNSYRRSNTNTGTHLTEAGAFFRI